MSIHVFSHGDFRNGIVATLNETFALSVNNEGVKYSNVFPKALTNTRYSTHPDLSRNLTNGVIHSFASRGIIRARSFVLPSLFLRLVHTRSSSFPPLHRSLPMVQHYASGQAICRCLICGPFQYVQFFYAWIRHRIHFKAELSPSKKQRERETMTVVASKRGRPRVFLWCRWLLCRLCYNLLGLGECVIRLSHFFFFFFFMPRYLCRHIEDSTIKTFLRDTCWNYSKKRKN